jgi:multisubunit Na+/H+ antiporter MnhE subunit
MTEKKPASERKLHVELVKQMVTLSTSGLGLVAALAWNNFIQEFVSNYIKKWFPQSGLISLFIYALIVTALAVVVTYQLSSLSQRLQEE